MTANSFMSRFTFGWVRALCNAIVMGVTIALVYYLGYYRGVELSADGLFLIGGLVLALAGEALALYLAHRDANDQNIAAVIVASISASVLIGVLIWQIPGMSWSASGATLAVTFLYAVSVFITGISYKESRRERRRFRD